MKLELRSVRLKNCGPIDDVRIDFFDVSGQTLRVCVLGGANGSGKTTILESTTSLLEDFFHSTFDTEEPWLSGTSYAYVQTDWKIGKSHFSLYRGEIPSDVSLQAEHAGRKSIHQSDATWLDPYVMTQGAYDLLKLSNKKLFPSLIYLPHDRSLEPVSGVEVRKEQDSVGVVHRFQTVHDFPGSLTSYLIWLDYAEPERYAVTQQFLNNLNFDGKTFRVDRKSLSVMVKTKSGAEHPLHELSSGEQNLLIILIELYRKLTPGSIVLIDEIENSLHPAFQHKLGQGLLKLQREIPFQLIVTTHAPAFLEIFGARNTRLLTVF